MERSQIEHIEQRLLRERTRALRSLGRAPGFAALATTSSGMANAMGVHDQHTTRDQLVAHVAALTATGGLLLVGIALRLLRLHRLNLLHRPNLLPRPKLLVWRRRKNNPPPKSPTFPFLQQENPAWNSAMRSSRDFSMP